MKLNLQATDNMQKVILDYLEQTVTETLANKINNGVEIFIRLTARAPILLIGCSIMMFYILK